MKVKSEREVAQLCPTPSDPMDYSLPGFSIDGIFQARVLEWGAIAFSAIGTMRDTKEYKVHFQAFWNSKIYLGMCLSLYEMLNKNVTLQ